MMSLTGVSVEVAYVWMQPTIAVEVALFAVVTVSVFAEPLMVMLPSVANAPVEAVVVALPFTHTLPLDVSWVVEACWKPASPVKVDAPTTVSVPAVAKLPLEAVVVAKPLTHTLPDEVNCVVEACAKAASPVNADVPVTVKLPPVVMLVLIVVEACATAKTKNTPTVTATVIEIHCAFLRNCITPFIIFCLRTLLLTIKYKLPTAQRRPTAA